MKRKSKLLQIGLMAVLAISLSGCVKLNMDLSINENDTVDGVVVLAVSDVLASLGAEPSASPSNLDDSTDGLFNSETPNMTTSKYSEGGFTGQKYEFKGTPLSAFKTAGKKEGDFSLERIDDTIVVSGSFDMTDGTTAGDGSDDPFSAEILKSMTQGMDLRISIKFPGVVTSTNGELSDDKKTVTWKLDMNSKNELQAVAEAPLAKPIDSSTLVLAAAIILGILALFGYRAIRKRSKGAIEPSEAKVNYESGESI